MSWLTIGEEKIKTVKMGGGLLGTIIASIRPVTVRAKRLHLALSLSLFIERMYNGRKSKLQRLYVGR